MSSDDDPRLSYTDADGIPRRLALSDGLSHVTIGRSPHSDIALTGDAEVSQLHATVDKVGGHWVVVDDGLSRNGTFVNGDRLAGRLLLRPGDRIRIGSTLFTFQSVDMSASRATRVSSGAVITRRSLTEIQHAVLCSLCRPYKHSAAFASPPGNQQIAEELFLSVDTIKSHMRELFTKFGVEQLPPNQKRVRLVERAMQTGIVTDRDL
ncbi:FHA domain-containing protein [Rhodococcus spelaei]|uniref:FHA domain-containing protein n=1 Tax=Rhodococcus spelaei TaxID=2546320 RepID=A0A541BMV5_9NOCA|nr:FHA domain-containing protein [Rhodococcus spelaei]TQF73640.1 FHA domain-containing protein [Rhodococcus spelaei]